MPIGCTAIPSYYQFSGNLRDDSHSCYHLSSYATKDEPLCGSLNAIFGNVVRLHHQYHRFLTRRDCVAQTLCYHWLVGTREWGVDEFNSPLSGSPVVKINDKLIAGDEAKVSRTTAE